MRNYREYVDKVKVRGRWRNNKIKLTEFVSAYKYINEEKQTLFPLCERREPDLMSQEYFVYILASKMNGTLYIGSTSDLIKRVYEHKNKLTQGFTSKYHVTQLVYFETYEDRLSAFHRETQHKRWKRDWKLELIENDNSRWDDLYDALL